MDHFVLNVFFAITGAMIIPLIPLEYLQILDTNIGRFLLLSLPVIMYHVFSPTTAVMAGVVVAIIVDRIHDLQPTPSHSQSTNTIGSGSGMGGGYWRLNSQRKRDEVLLDLSPDYTNIRSDEIVMLEPIAIRRKHGLK